MTRTRRSLYTIGAGYLNTGVALISGLVVTPLLLEWLGDERIGIVRMASEWFGYAAIISMGLDSTLAIRYAKSASEGDRPAMINLIRGALRAYVVVCLGSMFWLGLLFAFAPLAFNLHDAALAYELRLGLLIVMAGQLAIVFAAFKPLVEAEQRGYIANISLAIAGLAGVGMSLLSAYNRQGIAGQLAALTATVALGYLLMAIYGFRRYPEVLRHPFGPAVGGLFSVLGVMVLYQIGSRVSFLSDCIIVGQVLGVEAVTPFSITQRLLLLLQSIIFVIGGATWATLASIYHDGNRVAFDHRIVQLTRLVAVLSCATLVPAAIWNRQFVLAWVGNPERYAGDALTYLTAAGCVILCVLALWGWPLMTLGHVRRIIPYMLVGLVVNLTVSVAATYWLGSIGPALGTLVNLIGVTLWWSPLVFQRQLGTPALSLLRAAAGPWILAIPYGMVLAILARQFELQDHLPSRIARLAVIAGILGIASTGYLALAFAFVIPAEDRREWLGRFLKRKALS